RIIETLAFMLIVLSSGAFIDLIKEGGAREEGLENVLHYAGPLNRLPDIWVAGVVFISIIVFLAKKFKRIRFSCSLIALIAFCFASSVWATFPSISFKSTLLIASAYLLISAQIALYGGQATVSFLSRALFIILASSLVVILVIPGYGISVGA